VRSSRLQSPSILTQLKEGVGQSVHFKKMDCDLTCIKASIVNVSSAPANLSVGLFRPLTTGIAKNSSQKLAYISRLFLAVLIASSELACAV
jgi:hypothetical protein